MSLRYMMYANGVAKSTEKKLVEWHEYEGDAGFETRDQWFEYLKDVKRRAEEMFGAEVLIHGHPHTSGGGAMAWFHGWDHPTCDEETQLHELCGQVWQEHQESMK
jgi:hypothetical protein